MFIKRDISGASRVTRRVSSLTALVTCFLMGPNAFAQTGVDDDRVSLPEGPGSLEGVGENVEIDPNMGAMRYSVPIVAPSGLNGLTPDIGLSYSSSAGSGVLGVGWSMPSMTIERMTSRRTPRYDGDDYFASNGGDELVLVSLDGDQQVYRERFEGSFTRYTWHGVGTGDEGYWTAEYADGSVGYFGADAEGTLVPSARSSNPDGGTYKYHMVAKVDPYGHQIVYSYTLEDSNWPLISEIGYVFQGDTPLYTVEFDYEGRLDLLSDAGAGYEELLKQRLERVRVLAAGEVVREVVLSYEEYEAAGGFSRLENVKRYGLGGEASGDLYPIEFSFGYSKALGVDCVGADCDSPYLVSMGQAGAAAGLTGGTATLVDINADGLPDVVDTTGDAAHRILINKLTPNGDGTFGSSFEDVTASAVGTGTGFSLGSADGVTQVADINGDGLSDLLNTRSGATLLSGYGVSDWDGLGSAFDVSALSAIDMTEARFIDYNNDKRVDVIISTTNSTAVYENTGSGFSTRQVTPFEVALGNNPSVQLADMNGDGYNDVVEILGDGNLRYRLNYGWGNLSGWQTISTISIPLSERELVDLEDLNGDGLDDVVVVNPSEVKYAINRNGNSFDAFVSIRSADIDGDLPERGINDKVLYADMNGNGSEDVVWFGSTGEVEYLELFPVRPNLLSRIDNNIGAIQLIEYSTSAQQQAEAREAGNPWLTSLSIPMNVVSKVDTYVTLTGDEDGGGLHDVTTYTYRDGFYDGVEKQYRGFENVEIRVLETDSQEEGTTEMTFNVGRDKPHRNGLLEFQTVSSAGRVLSAQTMLYQDCALEGVPVPSALEAQGRFGVYFPCMASDETVIQEGTEEGDWQRLRTELEYDGYGNVTLSSDLGVVDVVGDEAYAETEYYYPGLGDRWFIGLPLVQRTWAVTDSALKTETTTYYDGDDFVGTQEGLTHAFVSRVTTKANADTILTSMRARRDEHGNSVETIDPNGSVANLDSNRRRYVYDDTGLFLTYLEIQLSAERVLRRSTQYENRFQKMIDVTDWVVIEDGEVVSGLNNKSYEYDQFGRMVSQFEPNDPDGSPSVKYGYELGEPFSKIVVEARDTRGGDLTELTYRCVDGWGRQYQSRTRLADGNWMVTGFSEFNGQGSPVRIYQPFTSASADCDTEAPAGTLFSTVKYDAQFREVEVTEPAEEIYGERLTTRTVYEPLKEFTYDFEDLDPSSPHFDTPTISYTDGQGRQIAKERLLAGGGVARTEMFYDPTGSFAGYTDPAGNRHELLVDLAGRVTNVRNESTGETTYTYDADGNMLSSTDAVGVTTRYAYDGGNRMVAMWDDADEAGTRIEWAYDVVPEGCAITECTNPANRLTQATYPTPFGRGVEHLGYDVRQRIVFQDRTIAGLKMSTKATFDNVDRLTALEYADGTTIETAYDALTRPTAMPGLFDAITYTGRGLPAKLTYANGASAEFMYDDLLRLESKTNKDAAGELIEGLVFDRDRVGNIINLEDMTEGAFDKTSSYEYDAWYRVTKASGSNGGQAESLTYGFDEIDRITSVSSSLDAASAAHVGDVSYDADRPLLVKSAGELEVGFDAAGRMTERGATAFAWDFMDRMVRAERAGAEQTHVYGADRERVAVIGADDVTLYGFNLFEVRDGVSHVYVKVMDERVAKTTSTELMTSLYTDGDADGAISAHDAYLLGETDGIIGTTHTLGAAAARMLAEGGEATTFFHTDNLRSLVAATNAAGEVTGRRRFSPTGVVLDEEGHVDVYGFTGQEHNAFTGLIQFKLRDFDALLGRWTMFDPLFAQLTAVQIESVGEATTGYAYVANNFANNVDPLGLVTQGGGDANGGGGGNANPLSAGTTSIDGNAGGGAAGNNNGGVSAETAGDIEDMLDEVEDGNDAELGGTAGAFFSEGSAVGGDGDTDITENWLKTGDAYQDVLDKYSTDTDMAAVAMAADNRSIPAAPSAAENTSAQAPAGGQQMGNTLAVAAERAKNSRDIKRAIGGIVVSTAVIAAALVVADGEDSGVSPFDNYSWK